MPTAMRLPTPRRRTPGRPALLAREPPPDCRGRTHCRRFGRAYPVDRSTRDIPPESGPAGCSPAKISKRLEVADSAAARAVDGDLALDRTPELGADAHQLHRFRC